MPALVVRVTVEPLGEYTHGLWCPSCLLPSGISGDFGASLDGRLVSMFHLAICVDCDRQLDGSEDS